MRARALRSLAASVKYINSKHNWTWAMTEAAPISVVAPFTVAVTAGNGSVSASAGGGHGVLADDYIVGAGFVAGTRVSATAASAIGFSPAASATVSATVTFGRDFYPLPTDWKQPYTVKLLTSRVPLHPANRRLYDRVSDSEFNASTPEGYDLFGQFQRSKVRLLPPPAQADVLMLRYYRRMTVPTSTSATAVLDIPQDYDYTLIAWAKWHFLTDKEDMADRATTWISLANEGIKTMMADQLRNPDESLALGGRTGQTWSLDHVPRVSEG